MMKRDKLTLLLAFGFGAVLGCRIEPHIITATEEAIEWILRAFATG